MAQTTTKEKGNDTLPVLAAALMGQAGGGDPQVQMLLKELVGDLLEKRKKEREKQERLAINAVQAAKESEMAKNVSQTNCSHRNQKDETRLSGQYLSGTGQLCLVCKFCGKNFHRPAFEGQNPVPPELLPHADEIGG